jgi:hypothetical protein
MGIKANFGASGGATEECEISCASKAVCGNKKALITRQVVTQELTAGISRRLSK